MIINYTTADDGNYINKQIVSIFSVTLKLRLLVVQTLKKEFGNAAAVIKCSSRAVIQTFHKASLKKIFAYCVPLLLHTRLGIYIRKSRERNVANKTVTALFITPWKG